MVTSQVTIELLVKNVFHYITDCDHVLTFMWPIIVNRGTEVGATPQKKSAMTYHT